MSKENIILYHGNCMDGFAAAFAAWLKFGDEAEYIPVQYGKEPPDVTGKLVYILDFSYPKETLLKMREQAEFLLVLDHHKTAKEALEGLDFCEFDMNRSGCMMAYNYFRTSHAPHLFNLIQDRDLWRFEYEESKPLHAALHSVYPRTFEDWKQLLDLDVLERTVGRGEDILQVFEKEIEGYLGQKHPVELNGLKGLAVNLPPKYASEIGHKLAIESGTFGMSYWYSGAENKWLCSLRSTNDFDVSQIAQKFGGGGHKNAAGFSVDVLNF